MNAIDSVQVAHRLNAAHSATSNIAALDLEVCDLSKRFGEMQALDQVSLRVRAGSVHALLGENGAGKSTLVKCVVGYHRPDQGSILIGGRERDVRSPHDAHALGIGMVYQHFMLVPGMSVLENLVMARGKLPWRIDWRAERRAVEAFLERTPFRLDPDRRVSDLAAGEKQKLEILKQLYLDRRLIILDEPTSVLTLQEADQVLGLMREFAHRAELTVLLITHKFREVRSFADDVTVLRRGKLAGGGAADALTDDDLAGLMVGKAVSMNVDRPRNPDIGPVRVRIEHLSALNDRGVDAVRDLSIEVRSGEIVGIAGVSGNGQRELVQTLLGQRQAEHGDISINGEPYRGGRDEQRRHAVHSLPEEPLRNACVPAMSVAENLGLRNFDRPPMARMGWLSRGAMLSQAERLIGLFRVKTSSPVARIDTLSGGNVQRAVLARELTEDVAVLIVANPVFGLDFAAVSETHDRIMAARNNGAAVLLVSEDLDELLELSDRLIVMSEGRAVYETLARDADVALIGLYMAGHAARAASPLVQSSNPRLAA